MKQIIQLGTSTATNYRDDELKIASALGSDCMAWIEAGADFLNSTLQLFNRANGTYISTTTANTAFTIDSSGTAPIFVTPTTSNKYILGSVGDEFTAIFVGKAVSGVTNRLLSYDNSYTPGNGNHCPHLYINSSNRIEYNSKGTANQVIGVALTAAQVTELAIYTVTFSVEKGINIYRNGELIAQNSTFVTPLDYKQICLRDSMRASFGHNIIANIDLSKDENSTKFKLVHDALKTRYGIA